MKQAEKHNSPPERLKALQTAFAGHIRNPRGVEAPGDVEDRRMHIYRDLFFKNIANFISKSFPVLKRLYDEDEWQSIIRGFFVEHRCQTPLFPELPREFLRYIQEQLQDRKSTPPFMLELAHYEWVELALMLESTSLEQIQVDMEGDLLDSTPVLSPLAWPVSYRFPVHRISPDFQPRDPPEEATHLLVYRDRNDDVHFMRLNAVSRLLIDKLQGVGKKSGREVLHSVAREIGREQSNAVLEHGLALMREWLKKDILLGTLPRTNR